MSTRPQWNVERGRQLHDQGLSDDVIAERCGTTKPAVKYQRLRHWGSKRPAGVAAAWDHLLGRSLWDKGFRLTAIAKECGTTKSAVGGYASRNWPKRPGDAERHAKCFSKRDPAAPMIMKATPLPPGAVTLPPLPSLTFGDD